PARHPHLKELHALLLLPLLLHRSRPPHRHPSPSGHREAPSEPSPATPALLQPSVLQEGGGGATYATVTTQMLYPEGRRRAKKGRRTALALSRIAARYGRGRRWPPAATQSVIDSRDARRSS